MRKSIIRISCFIIILALILLGLNKVFRFKYIDGIISMDTFYDQPKNTVDVLFLGSSRCFEDVNTGVLWDEYGMASYILGGPAQPLWNSYYNLKEALKTQHPKLIVLEAFLTTQEEEYSTSDPLVIKSLYGMRWNKNKIDALKASVPKEKWIDIIIQPIQYHNRYSSLSSGDFLPYYGDNLYKDWKGYVMSTHVTPMENTDVPEVSERIELHAKTEEYYRKIIELAEESGIPIAVIISPSPDIAEEQLKRLNSASDIAKEYNVPFFNYNLNVTDIGLDYSEDATDHQHLNYRGGIKYTKYLGNDIKSMFDIPDRRGDKAYDSWQRSADYTRQLIRDDEISLHPDLETLAEVMNDPNFEIVFSIDGLCTTDTEELKPYCELFGIAVAKNGIWHIKDGKVVWYSGEGDAKYYISTPHRDVELKREYGDIDGYKLYLNSIQTNEKSYTNSPNGANVLLIDKVTESLIDTCVEVPLSE